MRIRVTPSFVVAVLALVVACGGSAYAGVLIGSQQIKDNSVTSADIKNGTLKAKDLKKASVTTDRLARKCRSSQVKVAGLCIDRRSSGPANLQPAILDCNARGGRFMTRDEFLTLRSKILTSPARFTWAGGSSNQHEFLSTWATSGGFLVPEATDLDLNLFGDSSAQSFWYRCVTYP
jgi:hypothetical protein